MLTYARAGHPPPLLRRAADGSIGALDAVGSCPLGIDESETFQEAAAQLERDDALLLYTDGITEAQGTTEDLFGVDRLTPRVSQWRRSTRGPHRPAARGRPGARARRSRRRRPNPCCGESPVRGVRRLSYRFSVRCSDAFGVWLHSSSSLWQEIGCEGSTFTIARTSPTTRQANRPLAAKVPVFDWFKRRLTIDEWTAHSTKTTQSPPLPSPTTATFGSDSASSRRTGGGTCIWWVRPARENRRSS